jgi:prophage maintenance system killer protein
MTNYLNTEDIRAFNERFVGPGQLRDFGLLDSATTRPQATVLGEDAYPTIHEKAAAMLTASHETTHSLMETSAPRGPQPKSFTWSMATTS